MLFSCAPSRPLARFTRPAWVWAVILAPALMACVPALGQLPSPDFFPIGVFAQRKTSMSMWKDRGINTMFQWEPEYRTNPDGSKTATVSMADWSNAAAALGLYYCRLPSDNPANDLSEKYLMAWTQLDEPDIHDTPVTEIIDIYQNLKAISPSKPVWVNFAGDHITTNGANYTTWAKTGDWLSADWYPFNRGYYNDVAKTNNINFIGIQTDRLRQQGGLGKKLFAVIESSFQNLSGTNGRAPTTDEFRGMIWEAIVHGATGILYFPQKINGGFQYDATPPNLVNEMIAQNQKIKSLGAVLNATWNPSGRTFGASDGDLEATWRLTGNGDYFFVLNQSEFPASGVTLNLGGVNAAYTTLEVVGENRTVSFVNGQVIDTFTPYAVHIYRAAPGIVPIAGEAVPEPGTFGFLMAGLLGWAVRRPGRAT